MADSDWWRELSARFKEIHEYNVPFWAEWMPGSTVTKYFWGLRGSDHCATRFEELAKLAGGILFPTASDKLAEWLTLLKRENPRSSTVIPPEGNIRPPGGRILGIALVASEHCARLAKQSHAARNDPSRIAPKPDRRGYRSHIRSWMQSKGIDSIKQAARSLGISDSTLKSIMTDKGEIRYSNDTLKAVLNKTNYPSGE